MQPLGKFFSWGPPDDPTQKAGEPKPTNTKALIREAEAALSNYQTYTSSKTLDNKIELASGEKEKNPATQLLDSIKKLLSISLTASEEDFKEIKKFSEQIKNVPNLTKRLHEIEEARKERKAPIYGIAEFAATLEQLEHLNGSKNGLPWEQYELGTSPMHTLSEKKAVLALLETFHTHLETLVTSLKLNDTQRSKLLTLKKELEEYTKAFREQHTEATLRLQMIKEAEADVTIGWSKERAQAIEQLISSNMKPLFESETAFQKINPDLYSAYERLKSPATLTQADREALIPLLKAAEDEEYLKNYPQMCAEDKKKITSLHLFLENQCTKYRRLIHSISISSEKNVEPMNAASHALNTLNEMNKAVPVKQPSWKQLLTDRGFKMTSIGKGNQGEVFKISHTDHQGKIENFVVKVFADKQSYQYWMRSHSGEKTARIQHENLIQTIGAFVNETGVEAIIMPYFEGTDLGLYMRRLGMNTATATDLTEQLIQAVEALHAANIVHQDIKGPNIMIRKLRNVKLKLVLVDAGFQEKLFTWKPKLLRRTGTPGYLAPEVVHGKPHDKSADIYSLGIVIYQFFKKHHPFQLDEQRFPIVDLDKPPDLEKLASMPKLKNLLERMFDPNPDNRPNITEIKNEFKSIKEEFNK